MFKSVVKKLTRNVKRVGCSSQRVLFTIYVHEIVLSAQSTLLKKLNDDSILSVCFERGGKLSSSSDRKFLGSREGIFNVYESLTLVGTLFKDKSTNKYQSKKGKLIIRELTKNKFGGNSYLGLGVVSILLDEYVCEDNNDLQTQRTEEMYLEFDGNVGRIHVTITSQLITSGGDDVNDDTMSVMSGASEQSEVSAVGASFDYQEDVDPSEYHDGNNAVGNDECTFEDANKSSYLYGVTSVVTKTGSAGNPIETIAEGDEEDEEEYSQSNPQLSEGISTNNQSGVNAENDLVSREDSRLSDSFHYPGLTATGSTPLDVSVVSPQVVKVNQSSHSDQQVSSDDTNIAVNENYFNSSFTVSNIAVDTRVESLVGISPVLSPSPAINAEVNEFSSTTTISSIKAKKKSKSFSSSGGKSAASNKLLPLTQPVADSNISAEVLSDPVTKKKSSKKAIVTSPTVKQKPGEMTVDIMQEYRAAILSPRASRSPDRHQMNQLQATVSSLQDQVSQQDKLIVTLTRQLHEKDELHRVTVTALRTELNTVKQELKRERIGREAVAVANQRADGSLGAVLADARDETARIEAEYSQVCAELEAALEALDQSKYEARSLESRLEDMTSSARDAATAATLSRLKLADYENENEELIEELIYAKMTCAQYANDFEEERKKNFADKKKLRRYAERVAALEVQVALTSVQQSVSQPQTPTAAAQPL